MNQFTYVWIGCIYQYFLKILFLYLWEKERERESVSRKSGRQRKKPDPCWVRSLCETQQTEPPRHPCFYQSLQECWPCWLHLWHTILSMSAWQPSPPPGLCPPGLLEAQVCHDQNAGRLVLVFDKSVWITVRDNTVSPVPLQHKWPHEFC